MIIEGLASGINQMLSRKTKPSDGGAGGGFFNMFRPTAAGEQVTDQTAMTYSALFNGVRIISEQIAMMPTRVHKRDGQSRFVDYDNPVDGILHRAVHNEQSALDFKQLLLASAILRGNGYAEIERNRAGQVIALWWLADERVTPEYDNNGRVIYRVQNDAGEVVLRAKNMLHLKGFSLNGLTGESVIALAREGISLALATEKYGSAFFGNGATPGGIIEWSDEVVPDGWGADAARNQKRTWEKGHRGAANASRLEILEPGQRYKQISIKPDEAQFLDTRRFSILEIARWLNIKPHKLGELERSTNKNIEAQNVEHVVDTLLPWASRLDTELNLKLFGMNTQNYARTNLSYLLRGDSAARKEFYQSMLDRGVYSIDEVRALEEMNPLEDGLGGLRMVPLNMMSVKQAHNENNTNNKGGQSV